MVEIYEKFGILKSEVVQLKTLIDRTVNVEVGGPNMLKYLLGLLAGGSLCLAGIGFMAPENIELFVVHRAKIGIVAMPVFLFATFLAMIRWRRDKGTTNESSFITPLTAKEIDELFAGADAETFDVTDIRREIDARWGDDQK